MSATLSGLVVLENARQLDGLPLSVLFDGQMWLGPGHVLTGIFRYFNSSKDSFPEIGHYFAWIHVAKYVPQAHAQPTNESVEVLPESGQRLKEVQMDDDLQVANSSNSSSETLDELDIIHVVGDIVHLIPANTDDMRQQVYTSVSGAAVNSNKDNGFFEVKAAQYTSHYKNDDRSLSTFPVRAHFNTSKYKNKIPIPFDNTYVSVEGFLESIETDDAGHATMFHMSVDNINFLGRANPSPSKPSDLGPSTPSRSSRFKYNFEMSSPSSPTQPPARGTPSSSYASEDGTPTRPGGAKRKR